MGTSTKITVTRDGLRQMIERGWDRKIAAQQQALDLMMNEDHHLQLLNEWRQTQQRRVVALARRIEAGDVEDGEIAGFAIHPLPDRPDKWDRGRAEDRLESLKRQAAKSMDRFEALKWPASGERDFTQAQLENLFGV